MFFLRYPYCYGYWKKNADIEKKHGNIQAAEEVKATSMGALSVNQTENKAKPFVQMVFHTVIDLSGE